MSEAKLRLAQANRSVQFSFSGPKFFESEDLNVKRNIFAAATSALLKAKFPQGMGRTDGKVWAAWQEVLSDDKADEAEMIVAQVEWLRSIAEDNALKIDPMFANAREAMIEYLSALCKEES